MIDRFVQAFNMTDEEELWSDEEVVYEDDEGRLKTVITHADPDAPASGEYIYEDRYDECIHIDLAKLNIDDVSGDYPDWAATVLGISVVHVHELTHWAEGGDSYEELTTDENHSGRWQDFIMENVRTHQKV